jgi:hypothetical protein
MNKDIKKCKTCYWYHPSGAKGKYKDWCCKIGKTCTVSIGECKLKVFYDKKKPV